MTLEECFLQVDQMPPYIDLRYLQFHLALACDDFGVQPTYPAAYPGSSLQDGDFCAILQQNICASQPGYAGAYDAHMGKLGHEGRRRFNASCW